MNDQSLPGLGKKIPLEQVDGFIVVPNHPELTFRFPSNELISYPPAMLGSMALLVIFVYNYFFTLLKKNSSEPPSSYPKAIPIQI